MRILGIDPGYDRLGIAIIDKDGSKKETLIYSSCIETSRKVDVYSRLHEVGKAISRIMDEYSPEELAIETLFITKNQKTAMRVGEARGIIIYEAAERQIPIHEYSPMQIKTAITGDGTSDKTRITKMVQLLVTVPEKDKILDDEYDAIAVALAHIASASHRRSRLSTT